MAQGAHTEIEIRQQNGRPGPVVLTGAVALALVVGVAAGLSGMWSLALLAPLFVAACAIWPRVSVGALVATCALDRFAINAGGSNARLDELVALGVAAALVVRLVATRRAFPRVPLLLPVLVYAACNILSTVASGSDLARGAGLDLIALDLIVLYVVLCDLLATRGRFLWAVKLWLGVAAVEAVVGVVAFAAYGLHHGAVFGVQLAPDTHAPMVYGTLYEANIFGSYMSAAFLLALALAAGEGIRRKGPLYLVCALTAIGLLLSATRSAWGATVLGAVLLLFLLRLGRAGRRTRLLGRFLGGLVAVGVVVGIGLAVAPSSVTGRLGARLGDLFNFTSGSGYGRLQLYKVAIAEWQQHPILGLGPGSFSYHLPGDPNTGRSWLPNLTLQALHDTGVVGLIVLAWLFVAFYVLTVRALRRAPRGAERSALAGLIAAVSALLICFQLTPGFSLGYTWALLAFGVMAARVTSAAASRVRAGQPETAAAKAPRESSAA